MNIQASQPIGVFDSGFGGLTVVRELLNAMPGEDIVYLGDSARVPYGIKSPETIRRFAREDTSFLNGFQPKLVVVACNTATATAIDAVRRTAKAPVVDVITPGAKAALKAATKGSPIGVIATQATASSGAYTRAIHAIDPSREVMTVACPLLVPIVEEGRDENDPIVTHVLCEYLCDLQRLRPGALILGCTHYPMLAGAIGKLMGPSTTLVSSAAAAAHEAQLVLTQMNLLKKTSTQACGSLTCYTTDSPQRFASLVERFGGHKAKAVEYVGTDELENFSRNQK
ncbi:MAG TPA: glutamate racemase [Phycisphaerae bacterium]|nr:glutamate racemase [Phycisphaerae bacterium]HPS52454.1 glutamate racemase [Phycisphaerae bacterium]